MGGGPLAILVSPDDQSVYVADWYEDSIFIIDTVALSIRDKIKVGDSPSGLAINPNNNFLYVANRDENTIMIVSIPENKILLGNFPFW